MTQSGTPISHRYEFPRWKAVEKGLVRFAQKKLSGPPGAFSVFLEGQAKGQARLWWVKEMILTPPILEPAILLPVVLMTTWLICLLVVFSSLSHSDR